MDGGPAGRGRAGQGFPAGSAAKAREQSERGPGRLGRGTAERALKRRLPSAVDGQRCWSRSRASLASGIRAAPPAPPKVSGAETVPVGPRCLLGCRFTRAVLRGRLCPDPSPGDPEAPRTLTSPFPGGRGSQAEAVHGAAEQRSGADGHSVSQAWVPQGPHAWPLPCNALAIILFNIYL